MQHITAAVTINIELTLLAILKYYCRENDLSMTQVLKRAARLYLGTKRAKEASYWAQEYQRLVNEGKIKEL